MERYWKLVAEDIRFSEIENVTVILQLFKLGLVTVFLSIFSGFLLSPVFAFGISYLGVPFSSNNWQIYALGAIPTLIGVGIIHSQIALLHEEIHHTVYESPDCPTRFRIGVGVFIFVVSIFPILSFMPIDGINIIFHPIYSVHDALVTFSFTVALPYITKYIDDYFSLSDKIVDNLLKIALFTVIFYILFSLSVSLLFLPENIGFRRVLWKIAIVAIVLFGVIFSFQRQMRTKHASTNVQISNPNYAKFLSWFQTSRKLTFSASILAFGGLPIISGVSLNPTFPTAGSIVIIGYLNLGVLVWYILVASIATFFIYVIILIVLHIKRKIL